MLLFVGASFKLRWCLVPGYLASLVLSSLRFVSLDVVLPAFGNACLPVQVFQYLSKSNMQYLNGACTFENLWYATVRQLRSFVFYVCLAAPISYRA